MSETGNPFPELEAVSITADRESLWLRFRFAGCLPADEIVVGVRASAAGRPRSRLCVSLSGGEPHRRWEASEVTGRITEFELDRVSPRRDRRVPIPAGGDRPARRPVTLVAFVNGVTRLDWVHEIELDGATSTA